MLDFIRSNSILHPEISSWISDIPLNSFITYSEHYIHELKLRLQLKFNTKESKKSVFIDNGSSSIINNVIQLYNCFYIQKNDFFLFEELIKSYKKQYKMIENNNFLNIANNINHSCVFLFTLINNITGEHYKIDDLIQLSQKKRNIQFIIDGAYKEYTLLTDYDIYRISREPNIHYIGTFSKAYGIPGFRIGYMLSDILLEIPYAISSMSAYMALKSLDSSLAIDNYHYIKEEQNNFINHIKNTEIRNHKIIFYHKEAFKIHKILKNNLMLTRLINNDTISISMNKKENNQKLIDFLKTIL
jgi:histidinol-phosphate aminotransferase